MSREWIKDTATKHDKKRLDLKEQFASYWHQINEINKLKPSSILEVGMGNGFVSNFLRRQGYNITCLDLVKEFCPSVNSSLLYLPFKDNAFDVCLCCEVLEHLPFDRFRLALSEFHRVTRRAVVLSLPDVTPWLGFKIVCGWYGFQPSYGSLPDLRPKKHIFDGQHYWEIGKKGYPVKRIITEFEAANYQVSRSYRVFEKCYHHFFILR